MQATVELPEPILDELQAVARRNGESVSEVIQRLVVMHLDHRGEPRGEVALPLIPASETGPISPVTGAFLDELTA